MPDVDDALKTAGSRSSMQGFLDVVEPIGNRVPDPIVLFLILIGIVIAAAHILVAAGVSVTYQVIDRRTQAVETTTTAVLRLKMHKEDMDDGQCSRFVGWGLCR